MSKLDTFAKYGDLFQKEHTELNDVQANLGAVTVGFLRALAECPNCTGVFRIPDNENWDHLYCPSCQGVWTHKSVIDNE